MSARVPSLLCLWVGKLVETTSILESTTDTTQRYTSASELLSHATSLPETDLSHSPTSIKSLQVILGLGQIIKPSSRPSFISQISLSHLMFSVGVRLPMPPRFARGWTIICANGWVVYPATRGRCRAKEALQGLERKWNDILQTKQDRRCGGLFIK